MISKELRLSTAEDNGSEAGTVKTEVDCVPSERCRLTPASSSTVEDLSCRSVMKDGLSGLGLIVEPNRRYSAHRQSLSSL